MKRAVAFLLVVAMMLSFSVSTLAYEENGIKGEVLIEEGKDPIVNETYQKSGEEVEERIGTEVECVAEGNGYYTVMVPAKLTLLESEEDEYEVENPMWDSQPEVFVLASLKDGVKLTVSIDTECLKDYDSEKSDKNLELTAWNTAGTKKLENVDTIGAPIIFEDIEITGNGTSKDGNSAIKVIKPAEMPSIIGVWKGTILYEITVA